MNACVGGFFSVHKDVCFTFFFSLLCMQLSNGIPIKTHVSHNLYMHNVD